MGRMDNLKGGKPSPVTLLNITEIAAPFVRSTRGKLLSGSKAGTLVSHLTHEVGQYVEEY